MTKLWDKGYQLDQNVESFTVGEDIHYDERLIIYDSLGSMAHAAMLRKIGILSLEEFKQLHFGLLQIIDLAENGNFTLSLSDEDVHTAVENYLTKKCGEAGKKLHTARSRNDQIALDTRLYIKQQLRKIGTALLKLCNVLGKFAEKNKTIAIPGRTHMQKAMPSSFGLWAGAFLESMLDNFRIVQQAYNLNNQCPLGSAASYGSAIPIDRQYTANLLGFSKVQNNVLYANNSRGKFEAAIVHAMSQIMNDLSRIASDLILYSIPEFGYVSLPREFCSGSSLMPQKHNPCALELVRAKAASVTNSLHTLFEIIRPLPSGYSRDLQETKVPLMKALDISSASIAIVTQTINGLEVNTENCLAAFSKEVFATDAALTLVEEGIPFRDAYRKVALEVEHVPMQDPVKNILSKKHIGSTGSLGIAMAIKEIHILEEWVLKEEQHWGEVINRLTNLEELSK